MEEVDSKLFLSVGFWPAPCVSRSKASASKRRPERLPGKPKVLTNRISAKSHSYPARVSLSKNGVQVKEPAVDPTLAGHHLLSGTPHPVVSNHIETETYNIPRAPKITFKYADDTHLILGTASGDVHVFDVTGEKPRPRNLLFCNDGSAVRCGCVYSHQVRDISVAEISGHVKCEPEMGGQKHAVVITATQEGHVVMWNISDGRALYSVGHTLRDYGCERAIKKGILHFEHSKESLDASLSLSKSIGNGSEGNDVARMARSSDPLVPHTAIGSDGPYKVTYNCARRVLLCAGWSRELQILDARDLELVSTFDECFNEHISDLSIVKTEEFSSPEQTRISPTNSISMPLHGMHFTSLSRLGTLRLWKLSVKSPESGKTQAIEIPQSPTTSETDGQPSSLASGFFHGSPTAFDPIELKPLLRPGDFELLSKPKRWSSFIQLAMNGEQSIDQSICFWKPKSDKSLEVNSAGNWDLSNYESQAVFRTSRYKRIFKQLCLQGIHRINCGVIACSVHRSKPSQFDLEATQRKGLMLRFKELELPSCDAVPSKSYVRGFIKVEVHGSFLAVVSTDLIFVFALCKDGIAETVNLLGTISVPSFSATIAGDSWLDMNWIHSGPDDSSLPALFVSTRHGTSCRFNFEVLNGAIVPILVKVFQTPPAKGETQTLVLRDKVFSIRNVNSLFRFYEWHHEGPFYGVAKPECEFDLSAVWPLFRGCDPKHPLALESPAEPPQVNGKQFGKSECSDDADCKAVTYISMVDEGRIALGFSNGDIRVTSMSWIFQSRDPRAARKRKAYFLAPPTRNLSSTFGNDFVDELVIKAAHAGAISCLLATTLQRGDHSRYYLISTGLEWSLKIWNMESPRGYLLASFRVHNAPVYQIIHVEKHFELVLSNCMADKAKNGDRFKDTSASGTPSHSRRTSMHNTPQLGPDVAPSIISEAPSPAGSPSTRARDRMGNSVAGSVAGDANEQIQFSEFSGGPKRKLYFGRLKGCFLTLSSDNAIGVFSLDELSFLRVLRHDETVMPIRQLVWRPYEDHFLVESADSCVYIWTMRGGKLDRIITSRPHADEVLNGRLQSVADKGDKRTTSDYAEWRNVVEWNPTANLAGSVRQKAKDLPPQLQLALDGDRSGSATGPPSATPQESGHSQTAISSSHQETRQPAQAPTLHRTPSEHSLSRLNIFHSNSSAGNSPHLPGSSLHSRHRFQRLLKTPGSLQAIGRKRSHKVNLSGAYSTLPSAARTSPRHSGLSMLGSRGQVASSPLSLEVERSELSEDAENFYYYSRYRSKGLRDDNFRFGRRAIWGHLRDYMTRESPAVNWHLTPIWLSSCHEPIPSAYMITFDVRRLVTVACEWARTNRRTNSQRSSKASVAPGALPGKGTSLSSNILGGDGMNGLTLSMTRDPSGPATLSPSNSTAAELRRSTSARSKMVPRDATCKQIITPWKAMQGIGASADDDGLLAVENPIEIDDTPTDARVAKLVLLSLVKWTGSDVLFEAVSERLNANGLMQGHELDNQHFGFTVKGADGYLSLQSPQATKREMNNLWFTGSRIFSSYVLTLNALLRAFFAEVDPLFFQTTQKHVEEARTSTSDGEPTVGDSPKKSDAVKCSASLYFCSKYWYDSCVAIQQTCRAEVLYVIRTLDKQSHQTLQRYWHRLLPKDPEGTWWRKNWKLSMRATLILSAMCLEAPREHSSRMQRDIANALTILLSEKSPPAWWSHYQNASAYFMGKGFLIWEPYINAQAVIRMIFDITRSGTKNTSLSMACRQAIIWIAQNSSPLFTATICSDLTGSASAKDRSDILRIMSMVANKRPQVFVPYLPHIADSVVKGLDPNMPAIREDFVQSVTPFLHDFVKTYACISVHTGSQRLAVGSVEGPIVVFDLKTGTKYMILEGHTAGVSVVSFSADGHYIVSFSKGDQSVRTWSSPTGWLGMLAVAVGSAARSMTGQDGHDVSILGHTGDGGQNGKSHHGDNVSISGHHVPSPIAKRVNLMRNVSTRSRGREEAAAGKKSMERIGKSIFAAASTVKASRVYTVPIMGTIDFSDALSSFPQRLRFEWTGDRTVALRISDADHTCFSFDVS